MSIGAILTGVGAVGSAIGGFMGNKSSAKEAAKNREWQERMDNTKHQREVQDLLAAGLNPILSASYGGSVPSGATAAQTNPMSGLGETVNAAVRMSEVDKEKIKIEKQQVNANELVAYATAAEKGAIYHQTEANEELIRQNIQNAATDNLIKSYTLENVMPEQAKLLRMQAFSASASAAASTAQASLDMSRKNLVDLDVNKRSKSKEYEPDAEVLKVFTEGASNSANAVSDIADVVNPLRKVPKLLKKSTSEGKTLPSGQRINRYRDDEYFYDK